MSRLKLGLTLVNVLCRIRNSTLSYAAGAFPAVEPVDPIDLPRQTKVFGVALEKTPTTSESHAFNVLVDYIAKTGKFGGNETRLIVFSH